MSDSCGCCQAPVPPTPECMDNRPGLSAVVYRVGSYPTFRQAMLQAIAGTKITPEQGHKPIRPLNDWTSRQSDDFGIALLEMWAYLADILTFYQERIANEAYLRTAVHRESVLRLAALLDYRPANGMAATTQLAFTVDKGKTVVIPIGLRAQSVPGQDEKPQKFETVETLTVIPPLNHFRVYPQPTADTPLAAGRTVATALGDISYLAAGEKIVIYQPVLVQAMAGPTVDLGLGEMADHVSKQVKEARHRIQELLAEMEDDLLEKAEKAPIPGIEITPVYTGCDNPVHVEDKEVADIQQVDWRQEITWEPAVRCSFSAGAKIHKWTRKFRLFGHNAPAKFFSVSVDSHNNVLWQEKSFDPYTAGYALLQLDGVYDDLKENTELLVAGKLRNGAVVQTVTVTAVEQVAAQIPTSGTGPPVMQATVTRVAVSPQLPIGIDVRSAVVYELEGPPISLWQSQYGPTISGNAVYVPLSELGLTAAERAQYLVSGRRIILEDGAGRAQASKISSIAVEGDHLKITLADALQDSLVSATATGRANVVLVTHGETVADEVLGSGDASQGLQSFALKKSPVTFVPQAGAKNGAANTLQIRVDGVKWQERDSLYGRPADERVFVTRVDDEGEMTIQFGDGTTGARLPTGRNNVIGNYRQGIGQDGNITAGVLTTLLDKPTGLKSATNPAAAAGGAEPESLAQARTNAPNTVRTFERVVSLRDFEDAARAYAGIAKARASWQWDGMEQVVLLTVAGDDGAPVEPGGDTHKNLVADLDSRRDPNRKLIVSDYHPVALQIEAAIKLDASYQTETVQAAAQSTLADYFDFDNLNLGQPIHLSDVYRVVQEVEGVEAVEVNRLQFKSPADRASHGATVDPVQAHLAIWLDELATLAAADITITLGLTGET